MPISDSLPAETQDQLIDDPNVGDFGMEIEAKMDPKQLARALGFKNHLPFSFNPYRHKFGTSPWDNESLFKFATDEPLPQFIDFLKLHWHQLAGIHSIVRSVFLENPDDSHPTGVLIGDEVGLGKTAQSIAFIAFLNQVLYVQSKGLSPPPILGKNHLS
jgi:TATA-binding protein-associated factor